MVRIRINIWSEIGLPTFRYCLPVLFNDLLGLTELLL